jgi:aconitate hydratase
MMRGSFANIRIKNQMLPGVEGGVTIHYPSATQMPVYDAAMQYGQEKVPLVIFAGREYGTGSSRDWAAKGTRLLGVRAVIAQSFERIHRSNLIGMGVLPLEFMPEADMPALGLSGHERYSLVGLSQALQPGGELTVRAEPGEGAAIEFQSRVRIDTPIELEYYRHGGILHMVLRQMLGQAADR